jgi:hypothetical protein
MILLVGWDKRQLSRAGPPFAGLRLVGRRSHSLAGPTLLSTDAQVFPPTASKLHDLLDREEATSTKGMNLKGQMLHSVVAKPENASIPIAGATIGIEGVWLSNSSELDGHI